MSNNQNNNSSDIYSLHKPPETLPERLPDTVVVPPDDLDIFAIKQENTDKNTPVIKVTLSEGISLCGAYRLDKRLFQDETGEFWKASDLRGSKNVIVHLLPLGVRKDQVAIEPFGQNSKRIEALDHPRIVPILGAFYDPEHGFFTVRKFVNGKTLDVYRKDYIKRHGKLAATKAVKILGDIAHALDYAHGIGIFHRAICPQNIFIGLDDEVYLANFSLADHQAVKPVPTKPYQSPEEKEGASAGAKSDVYALAVVTYEILAGSLPFSPDSIDTVPLPIPDVPSSVDAVIQKAMAKDPEDRYASCGAFVRALETSFQESIKIKPVVVPAPSKGMPQSSDSGIVSRAWFWGTLLGLLILIGGLTWILRDSHKPMDEQTAVEVVQKAKEEEKEKIKPEVKPEQPIPVPNQPDDAQSEPDRQPEPAEPEPDVKHTEPDESPDTEDTSTTVEPVPSNSNAGEKELIEAPSTAHDFLYENGERKIIVINGVECAFRYCRPGRFMMGSNETESGHLPNETLHEVSLTNGFWLQETEVTQELWETAAKGTYLTGMSNRYGSKQLPVENVSWNECQEFIKILNDSDHLTADADFEEFPYRFALPTEAQWEYACRAGTNTAFAFGDSLNNEAANYADNPDRQTKPVSSYAPNAWGLCDMHGNVSEWCLDGYGEDITDFTENPDGYRTGTYKVRRGGRWESSADDCRSARRSGGDPQNRSPGVGLRLAIVPAGR